MDIIVNAVFFLQSVLQIIGVPIRFQIDMHLKHETTTAEIIGQSGVIALLVTIACFVFGSSDYVGLWFRLLRLVFIVNTVFDYFPQTYILISGMVNGLLSCSYALIFLFNLILIYSSIAHSLYANSDPFHFISFSMSIVAFMQVATFDSWSNILLVNIGGCDSDDTEYTGTQNNDRSSISTFFGNFYLPRCDNPQAHPESAGIIFWSFVFLGSFIMISMSLAAVAIGIMVRLDEIKDMDIVGENGEAEGGGAKRRRSQIERIVQNNEDDERMNEMREIVEFLWSDKTERDDFATAVVQDLKQARGMDWASRLKIVKRPWFRMGVVALTYTAAILQLLINLNDSQINEAQICIQALLSLDLAVRIASYFPEPWRFFYAPFRSLEFVSVFLLWFQLFTSTDSELQILQFLYFFRVFLTFKQFLFVDELSSVINSLIQSIIPFSYVLLLMFVIYYFFAVAGIILFKEADPFHWGSFGAAINTLIQIMTYDSWSWIMRIAMVGCAHIGYTTGFPNYDSICADAGDGVGMGWWAVFHFFAVMVTCAMILLSLLVGVILSTLEMYREELLERRLILLKAAPIYVQYKFSPPQVRDLERLFTMLDEGQNGSLSFNDVTELFVVLGLQEEEQFEWYMKVDEDGSGQIGRIFQSMNR